MTSYFAEPAILPVSSRMALKAEITFDSDVVQFGFHFETDPRNENLRSTILRYSSKITYGVLFYIEYKNN